MSERSEQLPNRHVVHGFTRLEATDRAWRYAKRHNQPVVVIRPRDRHAQWGYSWSTVTDWEAASANGSTLPAVVLLTPGGLELDIQEDTPVTEIVERAALTTTDEHADAIPAGSRRCPECGEVKLLAAFAGKSEEVQRQAKRCMKCNMLHARAQATPEQRRQASARGHETQRLRRLAEFATVQEPAEQRVGPGRGHRSVPPYTGYLGMRLRDLAVAVGFDPRSKSSAFRRVVAQRAGISPATVSAVINGEPISAPSYHLLERVITDWFAEIEALRTPPAPELEPAPEPPPPPAPRPDVTTMLRRPPPVVVPPPVPITDLDWRYHQLVRLNRRLVEHVIDSYEPSETAIRLIVELISDLLPEA